MGLLDDAIREHLDLKRRRGADPAEVERAEREALGPVRRGPEEVESAEAADNGTAAQAPREYGENGDHEWGESFDEESQLFDDQAAPSFGHVPTEPESESVPERAPEQPEPEPYDEFATQEHAASADAFVDDPEAEPPEPRPTAPPAHEEHPGEEPSPRQSAAPPPADVGHPGQETAEYDVEQNLDKDAEDPLEETPEFLQDTPDHDRLWFEQRPPRDFDFEG